MAAATIKRDFTVCTYSAVQILYTIVVLVTNKFKLELSFFILSRSTYIDDDGDDDDQKTPIYLV